MKITALPPMEHVFTVKIKGNDTGQMFEGTFTYKRPNIRKNSEINKTAAILNGGIMNLDEDTKLLHEVLATLKHTLTVAPDWWEKSDCGYELYDSNVVFEVYQKCMAFEKEYAESVWVEKEEVKEEPKAASKK